MKYKIGKNPNSHSKERDKKSVKTRIKNNSYKWSEESKKKLSKKIKGRKIKPRSKIQIIKGVKTRMKNGSYKYTKERRSKVKTTWKNKTEEEINKICNAHKQKRIKNGSQVSDELKSKYELYRSKVIRETYKWRKQLYENWNGRCYYTNQKLDSKAHYNRENSPVIDHKISKYYGFVNNISFKIIGNIKNLCICSRKINSIKNAKIEEEFLQQLLEEANNENN